MIIWFHNGNIDKHNMNNVLSSSFFDLNLEITITTRLRNKFAFKLHRESQTVSESQTVKQKSLIN